MLTYEEAMERAEQALNNSRTCGSAEVRVSFAAEARAWIKYARTTIGWRQKR